MNNLNLILLIFIFTISILFSCNKKNNENFIDCSSVKETSVKTSIQQDFHIYLPNIIVSDDMNHKYFTIEFNFSENPLIPTKVNTEIFNNDLKVSTMFNELTFLKDSTMILIWDGSIDSIEQSGNFKITANLYFNNNDSILIESYPIVTFCNEIQNCERTKSTCNLIDCKYFNYQNSNQDDIIPLCN